MRCLTTAFVLVLCGAAYAEPPGKARQKDDGEVKELLNRILTAVESQDRRLTALEARVRGELPEAAPAKKGKAFKYEEPAGPAAVGAKVGKAKQPPAPPAPVRDDRELRELLIRTLAALEGRAKGYALPPMAVSEKAKPRVMPFPAPSVGAVSRGIGGFVSTWTHQGIKGPALAARIHQLLRSRGIPAGGKFAGPAGFAPPPAQFFPPGKFKPGKGPVRKGKDDEDD